MTNDILKFLIVWKGLAIVCGPKTLRLKIKFSCHYRTTKETGFHFFLFYDLVKLGKPPYSDIFFHIVQA